MIYLASALILKHADDCSHGSPLDQSVKSDGTGIDFTLDQVERLAMALLKGPMMTDHHAPSCGRDLLGAVRKARHRLALSVYQS